MYRYIGIEDLVANALIEILRQENSSRRISLPTLVEYGAVVKILTQSGQDAILFLTKDSAYEFMHSYGAHQTGMLFEKCAQHLARGS